MADDGDRTFPVQGEDASAATREVVALLDRMEIGLVVVDRGACIVIANDFGRRVLIDEHGLSERDGRLRVRGAPELEGVLSGFVAGDDEDDRVLAVARLRHRPLLLRTRCFRTAGGRERAPRDLLALRFVDPERPPPSSSRALCELFGLTPAEAEVALGVALGRSTRDIAASQGRSLATARTLLKRAYAKTGTHRKNELAALVVRLLPLA